MHGTCGNEVGVNRLPAKLAAELGGVDGIVDHGDGPEDQPGDER